MHKRIQELAKQATSVQRPTAYNPLTFEVFDKEKFAELIVRECVKTGKELYDECEPWGGIEGLYEHFGIKE